MVKAFSYAVAALGVFADPYLRIAATGGTKQGAAVSLKRDAHLGYQLPTVGQQTGEDEDRETWCRTVEKSLFRDGEHALQQSRDRK